MSESKVEVCETCKGSGRLLCEECNALGKIRCRGCDGQGLKETLTHTRTQIDVIKGQEVKREIPVRFSSPCDVCQGSGVEACGVCHGARKIRCETCQGAGQVVKE